MAKTTRKATSIVLWTTLAIVSVRAASRKATGRKRVRGAIKKLDRFDGSQADIRPHADATAIIVAGHRVYRITDNGMMIYFIVVPVYAAGSLTDEIQVMCVLPMNPWERIEFVCEQMGKVADPLLAQMVGFAEIPAI